MLVAPRSDSGYKVCPLTAPPEPPAKTPWRYLRPYRKRILLGSVLILVTNVFALSVPWLLGKTIDALGSDDPMDKIPGLVAMMIGFAAIQAVVRIGSRLALFNTAREAEHDLRRDLFKHLLRLEPAFYRWNSTGDVMSRLTNDVQNVRLLWGPGVLNMVNTAFIFTTALTLMLMIDPIMTGWALLPFPFVVLIGRVFGKRIYTSARGVQSQLGKVSSAVQEDLSGVSVIKTYTLEDPRLDNFVGMSRTLLDRNMALVKVRGLLLPALGALASVGTVVVIYVGGRAYIHGRISLGEFVQFNAYLGLLLWPTMALGWLISMFQRGYAAWSRIAQLMNTKPQIADGPSTRDPHDPNARRGALEVKNLTITLEERNVLEDVSFEVPAGTLTAIVGRTGSGKSTLVAAIPRLIEIPRGCVFLDGDDVTDLSLRDLRRAVGYAPQEAFLFSTTIANNIAFGYELGGEGDTLTDAERDKRMRDAAEAAGLSRDLTALPDGFDTVVGERGITLSGGQRQRVALARALATSPDILILDDSLSSVDAETEREILGHLEEALHGRTAILISHRVAAVKRADQIVVLDEGRVAETGNHDSLLAKNGIYAELYKTQFASTLDDDDAQDEEPPAQVTP